MVQNGISNPRNNYFIMILCEDEFADLDDNDSFGYYLELNPDNIIGYNEFIYNGLEIWDRQPESETLYGNLIEDLDRFWIDGKSLDYNLDHQHSFEWLIKVCDLLEIPYNHEWDIAPETNKISKNKYHELVKMIYRILEHTFIANKQLFGEL